MKGKFNTIKKSRKKSKDIDEKIEYLNKECQKTGLQEVMTTSNVYQGTAKVPNETYNEFTALNFNGLALGLSGVKGSAGGASVGTVEAGMRHGASRVGAKGIAISPPHPVTGVRQLAMTRIGGIASGGDFGPAKPGQKQGNSDYPTGAIMWFWDPNFLNGAGLWRSFEYDVAPGKWGWWDSNFMGFGYLNHNLDQFPMSSGSAVWTTSLASTINGLKVDANGEIGTPQTTVLTKNDLGDPSFIPIDIDGLSPPGYDYLKNKAEEEFIAGTYDLMKRGQVPFLTPEQVNKILVDPKFQQLLQDDPDLLPILQRMRAMADDGTEIVSTDITTAFPPSPPDKEPVDPPPVPPSEPPAPPEPNPYPDEKANPAGLDDRAKNLGYNDPYYPVNPDGHYIEMVSVAQDILSAEMEYEFYRALSQEESPNYNSAAINKAKQDLSKARANLDNWERWKRENNYIWKGSIDHAAEDDRRRAELEKQQTYETEMEKIGKAGAEELFKDFDFFKDFNKNISSWNSILGNPVTDLFLDLVADKLGGSAAKDTLDDYMRNFIPDIASGNNTSGSSFDNPRDMSDLFNQETKSKWEDIFKDHQESGDRIPYSYQNTADTDNNIGSSFGTPDLNAGDGFSNNGDGTTTWHKAYDFDGFDDIAVQSGGGLMNLGTILYGIFSGVHSKMALPGSGKAGKTPTMHMGITFDNKTGKIIPNYKPNKRSNSRIKESLDESVKLGHFEPEVLNVDINKLRKGILPEFPKNPPPKMIGGYSEKSKLRPKTIEGTPFINVTKKDLAKNHILKDSEIEKYMNEINMINDYIRKNPAELIHAMQRYPKDDLRLAQLNWQMDQRMKASEDYMETHFPENERLFNKLQAKIKQNIELTDPKNFTGHAEAPKFIQNDITEQERRRKTIIRHFKKKK